MLIDKTTDGITATTYIRMMPHTTAVSVAVYFGLRGRVYTTSSACTSGSQAIGYSYEAIKWGKQRVMVAGGAAAPPGPSTATATAWWWARARAR
jgi:3-oxoacyl-[acyl-carrier-protein] synthase II